MIAGKIMLIILLPWLWGEGALRLLYGKRWREDKTRSDSILVGWIIVIGLAEAAHLAAVVLGRSFSDCVKLFLAGAVVLSLVSIAVLALTHYRVKRGLKSTHGTKRRNGRRQNDAAYLAEAREAERIRVRRAMTSTPMQTQEIIILGIFVILTIVQTLSVLSSGKVYPTGDMTAETVNTMLAADSVYQINPMTGRAYTLGVPMRLKVLCLPTLYAILCDLFAVSAGWMVWAAVPVIMLMCCYLAYGTVAKALFPEDRRKRGIFLIIVVLLLWTGNYMYGMDGFAVQYAGFRGVSIRMAVLVPYTFGLILRKKWRLVPLCILAEACIVWTFYGMGACFFVTVVMLFLRALSGRIAGSRGGKGDDLCRN